jgi:hypothetical protein
MIWPWKQKKVGHTGWLYAENIGPLVYQMANWVEAEYTERDGAALRLGLQDSNMSQERWYETVLRGRKSVNLRLALQDHGEKIAFSIETDPELSDRLRWTLEILESYRVSEGNFAVPLTSMGAENYRRYIFDLVQTCQGLALEARDQCQKSKSEFFQGRLSAFSELISRLHRDAKTHHLDSGELGLDTLDPEKELTWD